MADYAIHDTTLTGISNVIRKKDRTSALIDPADYADRINLMGMLEEKTVSGAIATFADGADAVPLKSLVANLPASLTPYEEIEITHTGRNLFDNTGFPRTVSDTNYYAQFQSNVSGGQWEIPEIHIVPDIEYTFSFDIVANEEPFNVSIGIGDGRYLRDLTTKFNQASGRVSVTFVLTSALKEQYGDILSFRAPRYGQSKSFSSTISNLQLEIGSSASDFEPYQEPATYDVEIPNPNPNLRPSADVDDGMWTTNGTINPSSGGGFGRALTMAVSAKTTYDIYGLLDDLIVYLDSNKTMLSYERLSNTALSLQNERKTTPANCAYIGLSALAFDVSSVSVKESFLVYGGSIDIVNGQGEAWGRVDLGSLTWTKVTSGQAPYFASNALNPSYRYVNNNPNALVEGYTQASIGGSGTANGFFITDGSSVRIRDDNYTSGTANEFKEAMSGKYVVYELATPETFTFDPVSIDSKLGNNTMWSEQGSSTEVTYRSQGTAYPLPATLVTKTITENGTYSAEDDDADGYSEVTVNVPTGGEEIPFTHVFTAGTATDQYYTATEDGIYLAVGIRDQSTGCSINLPDGGTTLLTSSLLSNRAQMKVVQLTSGKRIHLSLYDSSHMRGGWVFKLNTTTPVLSYSNGYSSTSIPNHGTTDKVLSVIALAPITDNTTIWDKTMKCYVRGTYSVSNRYSWLRLMYGIDNEMPTISFSGGIGGQWLINLG